MTAPIRIPDQPLPAGHNSEGVAAYSVRPIFGLPTREILRDGRCVGLLYAPNARRAEWEIYATLNAHDLMGGVSSCAPISFASEAAALAFLGLRAEVAAG